MELKTLIFLDLETTGLPRFENNTTKITEISLIAVQRDHLLNGENPRILNKLTLCLNPCKLISETASTTTGLSNDLLQYQKPFNEQTYLLLKSFLDQFEPPICLLAYNGNLFDFPILKTAIHNTGHELDETILCADVYVGISKILTQTEKVIKQLNETNECQDKSNNAAENIIETAIEKADRELVDEVDKSLLIDEVDKSLLTDDYDDCLSKTLDQLEDDVMKTPEKFRNGKSLQQIVNETTPDNRNLPYSSVIQYPLKRKNEPGSLNNPSVRRKLNFNPTSSRPESFKLIHVYEFLTSKKAVDAHRAENDCLFMIECVVKIGDIFLRWTDANAKPFSNVKKMNPFKKMF